MYFEISSLPRGEEKIDENLTLIQSLPASDDEERGSDFEEDSLVYGKDSKDNAKKFTKILPEENEDMLKGSGVDRTEIIQMYAMNDVSSPGEVCITNQADFICQSVGGKVLNNGKWIPAENVRVEVSMEQQGRK